MGIVYFVVIPGVSLAIAILNGMGRSREFPLWLAVAVLAADPILMRLIGFTL